MNNLTESNKVLLICKEATFMVNAIADKLKSSGYATVLTSPSINELNALKEDSRLLVLYLGDYIESMPDFLVFLKDFCAEGEKALFLIGSSTEFQLVEKKIPKSLITKELPRPLNVKDLVDALGDEMEQSFEEMEKKSILVVDDDVVFLKMMKEWLSDNYRVAIANSGMRAITYLANNRPDLILLDYEMPVTDGPQVLKMIRDDSSTHDIPVIFLTGKGDRNSVMSVVKLKPDGYLLKTSSSIDLLKEIKDFFDKRKLKEIKGKFE